MKRRLPVFLPQFTADRIPIGLCTHIFYAFAAVSNVTFEASLSDHWSDISTGNVESVNALKQRQKGLKTILSFGGFTGSLHGVYSKLAASPENRAKFVKSAWKLINKHDFDGLNLDWQFPGEADRSNYVALIKELKEASNGKLVTASVTAEAKRIDVGYDVDGFEPYTDLLLVMTYDFHGSWENTVGHYGAYTKATAGLNYWWNNGVPKHKLIMGIGAYGRGWRANNCVIEAPAIGPSPASPFTREAGFASVFELRRMDGITVEGPEGPLLEATIDGQSVCYGFEDRDSVMRKMSFIKQRGFGGAYTWSIDNDDADFTVHRAILEGLGVKPNETAIASSRKRRAHCHPTGELLAGNWFLSTILTRQLRANSNPRKYEECVHGSWMVRDAPPGTEFDPATGGFVHASGGGGQAGHSSPSAPSHPAPSHNPAPSSGFQYSDYDLEVLKKTIWLEARGESKEGQIAVTHVIKNRARANQAGFGGGTIAGVCLKHMQFECWNKQKPADVHPRGEGYEEMDGWVRGVLDGRIADNTSGALYYNNPAKEGYPEWTRNVNKGVKIGNHQFYTVRGRNY